MKKIMSILYLCIAVSSMYAQNIKIKGNIVENNNQIVTAMEGVSVSLLNPDSTYASGNSSDKGGTFLLVNVKPGDYFLNISFIGYLPEKIMLTNLTEDIDLGTIELRESALELNEVTVTASNIVQKVDRMVVLPTQSALKNAYDTYELLNNLNIPRLKVSPINKAMESDGKPVQTRINGIIASPAEVSALLAKDILRINVIENPGKRYGGDDLGVVVDIIVRKREYGGSVNIQTINSPFILWGDNNLSVKYNQGKSQWGINYNLADRGFKKTRKDIDEVYYLENETIHRIQEGINDTLKFFNHNIGLSYNLSDPDKYTFNVAFRNQLNDEPYDNQTAKLFNYGSSDFIFSKTKNSSFSYSPSLDIYYQKNLSNNQSIQFNVVGTLINTDASRNYREYTEAGNDLALIQMDVDGKKQSVIGEAIYDKTLEKIKLSAGLRHNQMYAENKYSGSNPVVSDMKQAETTTFVEFQGKVKDFGYFGSLGMTRSYFEEGNQSHTYYNFNPTVRLSYDLHKKGFISYRLYSVPRTPSLSSLTDVEQAIDTIQIVRGNPGLTPYYSFDNSLNYTYTHNKFNGALMVAHVYEKKPIMESVFAEGDKMIIMNENQKSYQLLRLSASAGFNGIDIGSLKNFLSLNAECGYFKDWSYGNNYSHTYGNFAYDVDVTLKYKNFSFMGEYAKKRNRLRGETISKDENMTLFMLTYTKKQLRVGAGVMFPFTNNFRTGTERVSSVAPYTSWTYVKEAGQLTFIQVNYNFEFGKKYKSGQKRINNSDTDSGVIDASK